MRKICEDMIKIKRKAFTGNAITEEVTRNFTVEPYELCDDIVRNQIEIGSNNPKYSCVLYDRDTKQVYGYILAREKNIQYPLLVLNGHDKDFIEYLEKINGLEMTEIVVDKRLNIQDIVYLLNKIQKEFCHGNFKVFDLHNKYIWCYLYGDFIVVTTSQEEPFRGMDFNNLSKEMYVHVAYAEED